jgi:putative FmdB family regulatory protein
MIVPGKHCKLREKFALAALRLSQALPRSTILLSTFPNGGTMPCDEYFCHACKQLFSKTLSPAEYEEGDVVCPHCGSKEVEQRGSAFAVITSKKSA